MTREQQYWEDTQEALSRILDRCEEIDPQSGYDMLEDIQFVRGFINKHKPQEYAHMKARVSIIDDNGNLKDVYELEPSRTYEGDVSTKYVFEFEYNQLNHAKPKSGREDKQHM